MALRAPWLEFALWIPVGVIPIANGALRTLGYGRWLGEPAASLLSSALDVVAVTAWAGLVQRRWPVPAAAGAVARGLLWVALSTLDHFGLGALVFGVPLPALVARYDVARGETWLLVTLAILAAPGVAWWLGRRRGVPGQI